MTGKQEVYWLKRYRNCLRWLLSGSVALGFAAVMAFGTQRVVYGADSSVIEKVTVAFKSSYGEQEEMLEPDITVSGNGCSLGDVQYRTKFDNWRPGKKVRFEITINADSGKVFPVSLNRSACKVSGADFVSAKALDDSTLQVKVDYKPVMVLGDTQKAGWSGSPRKKATWKSVDYAPGYTLTLYGENKVVKRLNVETNSVDLSDYMKDMDKTYYYEVKAVPLTSDEKKYLKEGNYVTSTDQEFDWQDIENEKQSAGAGDGGSLKGENYIMPDGSRAVDTWKKVSGKWYYFDGNGNRKKGWMDIGGTWYYMDADGVMCTGWVDVNNGSWFYMGPNGEMKTGWTEPLPGNWYYLNQYGYMKRGWIDLNGKWYYLGQDGRMQTGWINYGDRWYYLSSDGSMAVNTSVDGWSIGADGVSSR